MSEGIITFCDIKWNKYKGPGTGDKQHICLCFKHIYLDPTRRMAICDDLREFEKWSKTITDLVAFRVDEYDRDYLESIDEDSDIIEYLQIQSQPLPYVFEVFEVKNPGKKYFMIFAPQHVGGYEI